MNLIISLILAQTPTIGTVFPTTEPQEFLPGVVQVNENNEKYPVRVYKKFRFTELIFDLWDAPLRDAEGKYVKGAPLQLEVFMLNDENPSEVKTARTLRHCSQLQHEGWYLPGDTTWDRKTRDDTYQMFDILEFMEKATPSRESYIDKLDFTDFDVDRIHAHWNDWYSFDVCHICDKRKCGKHELLECCEGKTYLQEAQAAFDYYYLSCDEQERNEIYKFGKVKCEVRPKSISYDTPYGGVIDHPIYADGYFCSTYIQLIGWGDWNHDGVEDGLLTIWTGTEGTWSSHSTLAFTCFEENGPLIAMPLWQKD